MVYDTRPAAFTWYGDREPKKSSVEVGDHRVVNGHEYEYDGHNWKEIDDE